MNRNQTIIIGSVVALTLGWGIWNFTKAGATEATQYKTATAEMKDLRLTVSATGIVQPFTVVDIKSRAGGEILQLAVDIGDRVKKGQLIARIDPTDSQTAFDQANADVAAARARISQAQQTRTLQAQTTVTSIAQAEAQVRSAEASVRSAETQLTQAKKQSSVQPTLTDVAIRQAKASLVSAEKQLAQLTEGTDPATRQEARSSLDSAQANLKTAQANLTNAELNLKRQKQLLEKGFVAQSAVDDATAQVEAALAQVNAAKASVAAAKTRAETIGVGQDAAIAAARSRVSEAQETVRAAEANRVNIDLRKQDVANAEASLLQARAGLAQAKANLEAAKANRIQIDIRGNDIATAQAQIARAEAQAKNTQIVLGQTTIRAPSDGVVLQKYVEQGTIIASGSSFSSAGAGQSIVQLGDLSRIYVDAQVDETDISQVKVNQQVKVELDAVPNEPFAGKVMRIEPRGVTEQNVTTVKTRIELEKPSAQLRPGLNGECEFLIAEKKNVLVIPSRAIRNEKGKKFVQVMLGDEKDPKIEQREITVGMETPEAVEVLSGLKAGDKVVTATIQPGGNGPGRGGPGGGNQGGGNRGGGNQAMGGFSAGGGRR